MRTSVRAQRSPRSSDARPLRIVLLIISMALTMSVLAQDRKAQRGESTDPARRVIAVGLYVSPPFVMQEAGHFAGFSIDLWESISADLGLNYRYEVFGTLDELVDATASGKVDVAVTNLTVTRDRAERIDFSQPWFDAGLRIQVSERSKSGWGSLIAGLRESGHLHAYAALALLIVLMTVVLTFFDRRFDTTFPGKWRDGLAESFHSIMSLATSGKSNRKNHFGWLGRIWSGMWLLCGVAMIAYVTSSVTSVMTTISLTQAINGPEDLPGREVGVFKGSVAQRYATAHGFRFLAFRNIDESVEALENGRINAIIGDAPVLEHYVRTHSGAAVSVVGKTFAPDKYAFALPRQSPLTNRLTIEILGAKESGKIQELQRRYFQDAR